MESKCKYCEKIFNNINKKVFANHVRWCPSNNTNGDKGRGNLSKGISKTRNRVYGPITNFIVKCYKCHNNFTIRERVKSYPKKEKYFCSRACANTRTHSKETKNQISNTLRHELIVKLCPFCQLLFNRNKPKQQFCSNICSIRYRYKDIDRASIAYYRRLSAFIFGIKDYPNEFNIELIEKYGWYKAKNHGNNLGGVSRDHMLSVKYGYENNIDPKIISHPANCKLMLHNENVSKNQHSSITLEELLARIDEWNRRYGINL